ncbi:MAG: small multi-drug export protein [Eubacterium sp.]|nr:small multi-drug export protein [Eubacterium sp.]
MTPVLELRAAIPAGTAAGLEPWQAFILAFIGNMIPVPFIIVFARRVIIVLRRKYKKLNSFLLRIQNRARAKGQIIRDYEMAGLIILVAIPLPGTGAWTGALAAALMKLDLKSAIASIAVGVFIAGLIVMGITYGVINI